jgi:hypothetical protein
MASQNASPATSILKDTNTPTQWLAVDEPLTNGEAKTKGARLRSVYERLRYLPPKCRYDPDKPFEFAMGLNILFGASLRLPL